MGELEDRREFTLFSELSRFNQELIRLNTNVDALDNLFGKLDWVPKENFQLTLRSEEQSIMNNMGTMVYEFGLVNKRIECLTERLVKQVTVADIQRKS